MRTFTLKLAFVAIIYAIFAASLVAMVIAVSGCAAGRTDTGGIVLGVEAGRLVETPGEAAHALSAALPPPWGQLASYGLTALGVGGLGAAAGVKRAWRAADAAWDESAARANPTQSETRPVVTGTAP